MSTCIKCVPYSDKVNIYTNECFIPLPPWTACPPPSVECPPIAPFAPFTQLKFDQTENKVR